MSLRLRVIAIVAGLVVAGVAVASVAAYQSAASEVTSETDRFLKQRADEVLEGDRSQPRNEDDRRGRDRDGSRDADSDQPDTDDTFEFVFDPDALAQSIDEEGVITAAEGGTLPVTDVDIEVAKGGRTVIRDIEVDGEPYRMITVANPDGGAIQIARETGGSGEVLQGLAARLIIVGIVVAVLSAVAGWLLMRRATKPLADLTAATERVASERDLTPLGLSGTDEVGRLAHSFDEMLIALNVSKQQQRRLVEDAGHELRTPLTSLRANIEFLQRAGGLPDDDRQEILDGLRSEVSELASLVDEVVLLASDESSPGDRIEPVDLAEVVESAVATFQRRTDRQVVVDVEPTLLNGNESLLDRAVSNLLGNADKFSPSGEPIEVRLAGRWVTVRDHGAGIPAEQSEIIFDRFHRSDTARSAPGSGLGLAIVRHVAEAHGGEVVARTAANGGAEVGFSVGSP